MSALAKERLSAYPVFERELCALDVLRGAGFTTEAARAAIKALAMGGFYVAPRVPTNAMLLAYMGAHGRFPRNPETILRSVSKARQRWQAMGIKGTASALSETFSEDRLAHREAAVAAAGALDLADMEALLDGRLSLATARGIVKGRRAAQGIDARRGETACGLDGDSRESPVA